MRLNPLDSIVLLGLKVIKALDKRPADPGRLQDPSGVKNILVISSTAIGDTLLSTPAIRAVRKQYPGARIIALLNVNNMELFGNNPYIDGIVPYYGGYKKFFSTIRGLRRHGFDLALIFHGNEPQATPTAYLSGAKSIIKVPPSKEYGFLLSNKAAVIDCGARHAIEARLEAARLAGCPGDGVEMDLYVEKEDEDFIEKYLDRKGVGKDDILIGFQAGAAGSYKMWPGKNFAELGKRLVRCRPGIRIALTGAGAEKGLCESIAGEIGPNAVVTAGEVPLRRLRALLKRMRLLVTNDTGTMHMAIALKTTTVSLFCPTDPSGIGPFQDPALHSVIKKDKPCNPCITKRCKDPFCMALISVDEVYDAAVKSLGSL